jgi:hypothetical protein
MMKPMPDAMAPLCARWSAAAAVSAPIASHSCASGYSQSPASAGSALGQIKITED